MVYDRFYYSILSSKEKAVYKKLYDGITTFCSSVTFSMAQCVGVSLDKICQYIALDNPHIFYADFGGFKYKQNSLQVEVHFSYWYTREEVKTLNEKVNIVLGKMLKRVSGNSDYEKELSVHNLIISNVLYDETAAQNLYAHLPRSNTILGVLFYKSAVCEGIAKTAKMLLNLIGIKCIVAIGTSKQSGEMHAWNIVKIDGKVYHLDITNDIDDAEQGIFRHTFFNLTDAEMNKTHEWVIAYPSCISVGENYFVKSNRLIHSKKELLELLKSEIRAGKKAIEFRCIFAISADKIMEIASKANAIVFSPYTMANLFGGQEKNCYIVIYS